MSAKKRYFNPNIMRATAYAMYAAPNRGIKLIDEEFFVFCLLKSNQQFFESVLGKNRVKKAVEKQTEKYDSLSGDPCESAVSYELGAILQHVSSDQSIGPTEILIHLYKNNDKVKKSLRDMGILKKDLDAAIRKGEEDLVDEDDGDDTAVVFSEFVDDLTERARAGGLQPVFCRDDEVDKVIVSLLRKLKNNPVLVGEPGVGKTAIAEALAQRIVEGNVPDKLKDVNLYSLSISSLMKNTKLRGQFEERIHALIDVLTKDKNNVLFIDEIHMIVGAGDVSGGAMDTANILKPYLARGDIRCIGATTYDDYRNFIKKDGALDRRFQKIDIFEPSHESVVKIMNGLLPDFSDYHGCEVDDGIIEDIIDLSDKYLTTNFPDKSIDCLDESCARANMFNRRVDRALIEEVIGDFSNIPVKTIRQKDADKINYFKDNVSKEIVGNTKAVNLFCNSFKKYIKFNDGVFSAILCGPPSIGKSSIVKILSESLYGKNVVIQIDGTDYQRSIDVDKLIGIPGYFGRSEEAPFVKSLRKNPYGIIVVNNPDRMDLSIRSRIVEMINSKMFVDNHGQKVSLKHTMFLFMVDRSVSKNYGFSQDNGVIDSKFIPFADTANSMIVFDELTEGELKEVIKMELNVVLNKFDMNIDYKDVVLNTLFEEGMLSPGKVRNSVRRMVEELILHADDDKKTLTIVDEELAFV